MGSMNINYEGKTESHEMEALPKQSGGGEGCEIIELTQKEYDDLPDTKLTDGKLYKIKDVNINGDATTVTYVDPDGNKTNVADELDKINNSLLTKVPIYNPDDDYIYINGVKWMKAGFSQIIIFDGTSFDPSIDGVSLTTHSPKGDVTGVAFAPTYDISDGLLVITLKNRGDVTEGTLFTNNPLDLRGYNTVSVDISSLSGFYVSSYPLARLLVTNEKIDSYEIKSSYSTEKNITSETTVTFDISGLSETEKSSIYFAINLRTHSSNTDTILTIRNITIS